MEASEKPQLPLEIDAEAGSVRLVGVRIVVERMDIADEATARVVRERAQAGEEPARTIRRAIEIGTRVLDREDTAVEVDYVRREFEQVFNAHGEVFQAKNDDLVARIEDAERRLFGDGEGAGTLGTALEAHTDGLAEQIAETFGEGRESAVQAQIQRMLDERDEKFMRRMAADDEANPLRPVLSVISQWTKERKTDQDERDAKLEAKLDEAINQVAELAGVNRGSEMLAEAEEAGTRKGRSFEEKVHAGLERIAASRGDCAQAVGDVAGANNSKKGDSLVEIGAAEGSCQGRIVFEVKDSQLTRPKAWAEMDGALEARAADYAILVVAGEEAIPSGDADELHEYQGNKMIVAVDPDEPDGRALELAYRYASLRVRAARTEDSDVDATAVLNAAAEARDAIAGFKAVRTAMTQAINKVEAAKTGVDGIERTMVDRLDRIESAVEEAAEAEAEAGGD